MTLNLVITIYIDKVIFIITLRVVIGVKNQILLVTMILQQYCIYKSQNTNTISNVALKPHKYYI